MLKYTPSELHNQQTANIAMRDQQICDKIIVRLNDAIEKHLAEKNISPDVRVVQSKNETYEHMDMVLTQLKLKGYVARIVSSYDEDPTLIVTLTGGISADNDQSVNK